MERTSTNHQEEERKPALAILVEGGIVQAVVSAGEHVIYRLIDLDEQTQGGLGIGDCQTDQEHTDIEVFTREMVGDDVQ